MKSKLSRIVLFGVLTGFLASVPRVSHAGDTLVFGFFCEMFPWLCINKEPDGSGEELKFKRWTVVDGVKGAAYNTIDDVNGDGLEDIILTSFGTTLGMAGTISVYYNKGNDALGENNWKKDKVVGFPKDYLCFPNEVTAEDIDGDGDKDLFAPSGFIPCVANPIYLGRWGLAWYEKTWLGWKKHEIVPYKNSDTHDFYHKVIFVDIDRDGIKDLLTVAEMKNVAGDVWAETVWFRGNRTKDRFEKVSRSIGQGGGGLPSIHDVDGDGDFDIVSAQYFGYLEDEELGNTPGSFIWFEQIAPPSSESPAGVWDKHIISSQAGPTIDFHLVENLFGDGQTVGVGANHTNFDVYPEWPAEALYSYEMPADVTDPWIEEIISDEFDCRDEERQYAPGVFAHGDIDDDGLIDVAISGDGDPRIYLVKQTAPGVFETHVVDDRNVGQAGLSMADLNGDGLLEIIVSTYEGNAVYAYELEL